MHLSGFSAQNSTTSGLPYMSKELSFFDWGENVYGILEMVNPDPNSYLPIMFWEHL